MFKKYNSYKAEFESSELSVTFQRFVLISINSDCLPLTISNFFVFKSLDDRSCWSRCALACIKTAVLWRFVSQKVT